MGHSPSIADMQSKDDAYRAYISNVEAELQEKAKRYSDAMLADINAYYSENGYDRTDLVSGKNSDFMQASDWSLANVKNIIDAIAKAVFGDSSTQPSGVDVNGVAELGKAIADLRHLEVYVAGKCFEVLSGIIESFGSSSSVSFNASYKSEPLGNGMHLFATVVCDSYKPTNFINNEEIYQYLYIYEVKYSAGEAQAQAKFELTKLYEDQIAAFTAKVEDLLAQLEADKITPQQYSANAEVYNGLIANSSAALDALRQRAGA